MRYNLQSKGFSLTLAMKALILKRVTHLEKFLKQFDADLVQAEIEVGKPSKHHQSGKVFYAEINLSLPGKTLRAESFGLDWELALKETFQELERQVKKHKGKMIDRNRHF